MGRRAERAFVFTRLFFLSLFTLGFWIPFWIVFGITNAHANDLIDSKIARGKKRDHPVGADDDEPKSTWRRIAAAVPAGLAVLVVGYVLTVLVLTRCH